ncbi:MAG: hypothetical protein ABI361_06220 [Nitrososphaera sp.]|jgi:hypothetical protein
MQDAETAWREYSLTGGMELTSGINYALGGVILWIAGMVIFGLVSMHSSKSSLPAAVNGLYSNTSISADSNATEAHPNLYNSTADSHQGGGGSIGKLVANITDSNTTAGNYSNDESNTASKASSIIKDTLSMPKYNYSGR